jgi:methyl-accepting chemotaxis protein
MRSRERRAKRGGPAGFLDEAIDAHVLWKVRLVVAVNGGRVPEPQRACSDWQCELGQWLHGDGGATHAGLPGFGAALEAHRLFHLSIGRVLELLEARDTAGAQREMMAGRFAELSAQVVSALALLRAEVEEQAGAAAETAGAAG